MSVERAFEQAGQALEQNMALALAALDVDEPELWRRIDQHRRATELVLNVLVRLRQEANA